MSSPYTCRQGQLHSRLPGREGRSVAVRGLPATERPRARQGGVKSAAEGAGPSPCGWWACPGGSRRCPCRGDRRGSETSCESSPWRTPPAWPARPSRRPARTPRWSGWGGLACRPRAGSSASTRTPARAPAEAPRRPAPSPPPARRGRDGCRPGWPSAVAQAAGCSSFGVDARVRAK